MAHTTQGRPGARTTPLVTALRVTAALTVVVLAFQFVTAGSLVGPGGLGSGEELHAVGAIALHVVSGLTLIAAALLWRSAGTPVWPTVVAGVVFVLTFAQAYLGDRQTLFVHVPGAMVLTVGAVWVLAWSLTRGPSTPRA